MNKKQKIIVSVVGITIVLLALLGLTYAYFLTRIQGNTNEKSISVTTANLELTYADGNGTITSNNIIPGTTLTDKEFTVTNNGNATVNNYAVYLEELVNELTRPDDMVYTLTCTSSKENGSCAGKNETTFPKLAGIIVTNSIDVGETQTYKLTVTYKEMGVDQSDDMGKKVSARVQIYNLQDIVDVTGTVTNASEGDYVEMHSNPKTSQITTDNKYLIAAVEPGTHTIYVKDKSGTVKGSKEITIKKGNTASVSGTNITVTNDSQTVIVDIKAIASTLTIDIGETKDYMPFEEGTLAYNILNNAKNKTNGTEFLKTPKTKVAEEASGKTTANSSDGGIFGNESNQSVSSTYQSRYFTYGTGYQYDTTTHKYSLTGVTTCKYSECYQDLVDKYFVSSSASGNSNVANTAKTTTNLSTIYLVTSSTSSSYKVKPKYNYITFDESVLSLASDDYGTSYYYRGAVTDNYVNFAGMCWRVVRIQGDGSVKLILEDQDSTCVTSDGNWNIPTTTGGTTRTVNFGYTEYAVNTLTASDGTKNSDSKLLMNYLNGGTNKDRSMATAFKNFQTGPLANYLNKLKVGDWCLNDKAYATKTDNAASLTSQEILDNQVKSTSFYYDSFVRLNGKTTKEPILKCNGTNMSKFADNTDMYVGTLTADEIVYAGGKVNSGTPNYYLINNYQKSTYSSFCTLSPSGWITSIDSVFNVNDFGYVSISVVTGNKIVGSDVDLWARPAVSLKSSTQITGGDGTISNPYEIS